LQDTEELTSKVFLFITCLLIHVVLLFFDRLELFLLRSVHVTLARKFLHSNLSSGFLNLLLLHFQRLLFLELLELSQFLLGLCFLNVYLELFEGVSVRSFKNLIFPVKMVSCLTKIVDLVFHFGKYLNKVVLNFIWNHPRNHIAALKNFIYKCKETLQREFLGVRIHIAHNLVSRFSLHLAVFINIWVLRFLIGLLVAHVCNLFLGVIVVTTKERQLLEQLLPRYEESINVFIDIRNLVLDMLDILFFLSEQLV